MRTFSLYVEPLTFLFAVAPHLHRRVHNMYAMLKAWVLMYQLPTCIRLTSTSFTNECLETAKHTDFWNIVFSLANFALVWRHTCYRYPRSRLCTTDYV